MQQIMIRRIRSEEWEDAMSLIWKTFMCFEAGDYDRKGIQNFLDFISDERLKKLYMLGEYVVHGAFLDDELVGVISIRNECHISLLFVAGAHHRRGIGRLLINSMEEYVRTEGRKTYLTVNAAPYAVPFYHAVGFTDLEPEKKSDGIIYTPMKKDMASPVCPGHV